MGRKLPPLALVWMYGGKDSADRLSYVSGLKYPDFKVINVADHAGWAEAAKAVPARSEVCVFWMDDGKPVGSDFLLQMSAPLTAPLDVQALMHIWAGNAVSVAKATLADKPIDENAGSQDSLMKLFMPVLDAAQREAGGKVHLAFSSTERLAPLSMDPVGFPS